MGSAESNNLKKLWLAWYFVTQSKHLRATVLCQLCYSKRQQGNKRAKPAPCATSPCTELNTKPQLQAGKSLKKLVKKKE